MDLREFDNDQRRESINSRQRFAAWSEAQQRLDGYRGSMVWARSKGREYLRRSYYDPRTGRRRQTSLGPRSAATEKTIAEFEHGRADARDRFAGIDEVLERQVAINRAIGLGRMPLVGARVVRALDAANLLGTPIRVVGTNAIYAYEAAAGAFVDPSVTATDDIDLLFDARSRIRLVAPEAFRERSLIEVLRSADRSFERSTSAFRASNRDGYLVDLIKPEPRPPWKIERDAVATTPDDLQAAMIEGLVWLENAPDFEAIAIDAAGRPLRIVTIDPRVFAAHKLWMSTQSGRDPLKRPRDAAQARTVACLVARHLPNLPYEASEMRMLPADVFRNAEPLFDRGSRS